MFCLVDWNSKLTNEIAPKISAECNSTFQATTATNVELTETLLLLALFLRFDYVRARKGECLAVGFDDVDLKVGPRLHFRGFLGSIVRLDGVNCVVYVKGDDNPAQRIKLNNALKNCTRKGFQMGIIGEYKSVPSNIFKWFLFSNLHRHETMAGVMQNK